jgi:hypothetical protein
VNSDRSFQSSECTPDTDLLRAEGWLVVSTYGLYCAAWKYNEDVVLLWKDGKWLRVLCNGTLQFDRS